MVYGGKANMPTAELTDLKKTWSIPFDFELAHLTNKHGHVSFDRLDVVRYEDAITIEEALIRGFDDTRHLSACGLYVLYKQLRRTPITEVPSEFRVRQLPCRRFIAGGTLLLEGSKKYVLGFSYVGDDLHIISPISLSTLNTKEHYFLVVKEEGSA